MHSSRIAIAAILSGIYLLPASVAAQDAPAQSVAGQEAADASEQAESTGVDIIVTAQRRSESLRDVPISIISKTGEQLERSGITNIQEVAQIAPGVKIDQLGNYLQPSIRGVSSTVSGVGAEAPVAIYVDGVIQPNMIANYLEFIDLDRIEVAKGPQGTLFGRNATGGAISIFTKAPSYTPTGNFSVTFGNYEDVVLRGYVSAPIIEDKLAFSLTGYYENHEGYDVNIGTGQRTQGLDAKIVRGKLLFEPFEGVKLTAIAQYQDRFNSEGGTGIAPNRNSTAAADPLAVIATIPRQLSVDFPNFLRVKSTNLTLLGSFEIGELGTLNTITGHGDIKTFISYDSDRGISNVVFAGADYDAPEKFFSQEVSFASRPFGPFSFVVGGYYYHDDARFVNLRSFAPPAPGVNVFAFNAKVITKAWAGFTEGTLEVTDRLKVIAGIRYSWEKRSNSGSFTFDGSVPQGNGLPGDTQTFDAWTPRLSIKYDVTDDTNVYFTYSRGFKSGGVASVGFLGVPSYEPETITAYEVGLKSSPVPELGFNLAGYYYKYKDLQVQFQQTVSSGFILNAASAEIYGVDADVIWRPSSELSLTGGVSVLSAKYGAFPNASVLRPGPAGNIVVAPVDLTGNFMTRAPKVSASLVMDYRKETDAGAFGANVAVSYAGTTFYDSDNRVRQEPYTLVNALLSYRPLDSNLRLELWGKNLTDETYIGSVLVTDSDSIGFGAPRTYGVTLGLSF